MKLSPLSDLLVRKPRPEGTLALKEVFWDRPKEVVESYILTDTLRNHVEEILETATQGHGQGFWVQAEYGAGKTHFLAVLAALLANHSSELWPLLNDEQVRLYEKRLQATRLFPVIVSLRGETQAGSLGGRSLMTVLLEGVETALQKGGLSGKVRVTEAAEYIDWLERRASPAIRQDVAQFVKQQSGRTVDDLRADEDDEALAKLIDTYFQRNHISVQAAASVKERLAHIYRQITGSGAPKYTGLLVVIDEYEGWEKLRPGATERAQDEDTLETLAYLLPRDLGYNVLTIVGSQSAVPAKLAGAGAGDRFIPIPLLASQNERDYDIIVSRRVRGLEDKRSPEISEYYEYCQEQFDFARHLTPEEFRDTFPFQPRCFEVVRHFKARDLPTVSSGISIVWETVADEGLLKRTTLIRVADLLRSPHLLDCLGKPVYKDAYNAYKAAVETLPALELEEQDRELAQAVLDTLFLWRLAYMENPRPMSTLDLAQATMVAQGVLKPEDAVVYVLGQMQRLAQIKVENQQASFEPSGGTIKPQPIFDEYRRRAEKDVYGVSAQWASSLFFTTKEDGENGLLHTHTPGEESSLRVDQRNLEYGGDVIVANSWRDEWGLPLRKEDTHFRIVLLTSEAAQGVQSENLRDARIAVVYPGALSEAAKRAAAEYMAWKKMSDDYAEPKRSGKEAEDVRKWLLIRKVDIVKDLVGTQLQVYMAGQVITRDKLAINAHHVLGQASNDKRFGALAEALLTSAYAQLPLDYNALRSTMRGLEAGRVFDGYFDKQAGTAERAAPQNFGVALGLSHPDKPGVFSPQQAKVFELIDRMMGEGNGQAKVWEMYQRLSAPPYGLPYAVIQLYLLAFVRARQGKVELTLKPDHKLRLRNGQAWTRDLVTSGTVMELAYKAGLEKWFHELVESGPSWKDAAPFAHEIDESLHQTDDPSDADRQAAVLDRALAELGAVIKETREQIAVLENNLGARLPAEAAEAVERLASLAGTNGAGYAEFFEQARVCYEHGDALRADDLRADQQRLAKLRELAGHAAEINDARDYLAAVKLRAGDDQLQWDRQGLMAQFALDNLAAQPSRWDSLREDVAKFRRRYVTEYQKHHRDTNDELARLLGLVQDTPRKLGALERLNSIEELGVATGRDLAGRFGALSAAMVVCPVELKDLRLEASPVCEKCGRALTDGAATAQVEGLLKELDRALEAQQRQLASEAIRRVLAKSKEAQITTFLQVVQAANLAALVNVMDDNLVTFIRVLLQEEDTAVGEFDMRRFAHDYAALDETDVPKAVRQFEAMLRAAFDEARKANPGKKTVRVTVKG